MADLTKLAEQHADLPEEQQKQAGQALGGSMNDEHQQFMMLLIELVDSGSVNLTDADTILNMDVYSALSHTSQDEVRLALINITDQVRHIYDFFKSEKTPNESPHVQTMVEHLWQMKSRVEEQYGDVFKF